MIYFNSHIERKSIFLLDRIGRADDLVISLQTLHRMPSEQWGCRPAFPTVFFCPLKIVWIAGVSLAGVGEVSSFDQVGSTFVKACGFSGHETYPIQRACGFTGHETYPIQRAWGFTGHETYPIQQVWGFSGHETYPIQRAWVFTGHETYPIQQANT